jgi:phage/plasmid-like protein (TIGR03299 family)
MAHELEMIGDNASMAYAGELPWHGLGTKVPSDLTPVQMLEAANLDWEVERIQAYANIGGVATPIGKQALVRTSDNKMLDVISDDWCPMQNLAAFEFFNDFITAGDMEMHTAGSLKGGKIVWALAKINESFTVNGKKDLVENYLLFTNPHSYGQSIDVRMTPTRVVCNNTLTLSLNASSKNNVKVSHRNEFNADEVKETMGLASFKLAGYAERAEFLANKRYSNEDVVTYFNRVFPSLSSKTVDTVEAQSRAAKKAVEALHTQPGAELSEGSFWSLYNTVTWMTNHDLGRNNDNRMQSLWYGNNKNVNQNAMNIALEMAS